jgi:hypothetical protein
MKYNPREHTSRIEEKHFDEQTNQAVSWRGGSGHAVNCSKNPTKTGAGWKLENRARHGHKKRGRKTSVFRTGSTEVLDARTSGLLFQ